MDTNTVVETVIDRIESISTEWGTSGKTLQFYIGDSTNNNRQPSVSQVIRYFTRSSASKRQREAGNALKAVYDTYRSEIRSARHSRASSRTDAIDINEFIKFFEV